LVETNTVALRNC